MTSKKQLKKRVEQLEAQVRRLENMHAQVRSAGSWEGFGMSRMAMREYTWCGMEGSYCGRQLTKDELARKENHPQPGQVDFKRITNVPIIAANTEHISGITLEELARFVIDGAPIERIEKFCGEKITQYNKTDKTESVSTPLGDIMISGPRKE